MKKSVLLLVGSLLTLGTNAAFATTNGVFNTAMSNVYHTPTPPNDFFVQNPEHVMVSTAIMAAIAIVFLIIACFDSRKFHSTVTIGMVMGAAACVIPESVDNYLGGCFWSQSHKVGDIMFVLMGREFDWYVAIMWWAFGAILGYILYAALLRHVSTKKLWIMLGLSGVADIVVEELLLGYGGIYTYFGNQPLVLIHHFPWWWLFVNSRLSSSINSNSSSIIGRETCFTSDFLYFPPCSILSKIYSKAIRRNPILRLIRT